MKLTLLRACVAFLFTLGVSVTVSAVAAPANAGGCSTPNICGGGMVPGSPTPPPAPHCRTTPHATPAHVVVGHRCR